MCKFMREFVNEIIWVRVGDPVSDPYVSFCEKSCEIVRDRASDRVWVPVRDRLCELCEKRCQFHLPENSKAKSIPAVH